MGKPYDVGEQARLTVSVGINGTRLAKPAAAGAITLTVRDAAGYGVGDVIMLNPGADIEETATISAVAGRVLTVGALAYDHAVNEVVQELTTPSALTLTVETPAGVETTYTLAQLTQVSTGIYRKDVDLTAAGDWPYRWASTTPNGAEEGVLHVRTQRV